MPDAATSAEREALRTLRAYITLCSLPSQGPVSGSLVWATPQQAMAALTYLEARLA